MSWLQTSLKNEQSLHSIKKSSVSFLMVVLSSTKPPLTGKALRKSTLRLTQVLTSTRWPHGSSKMSSGKGLSTSTRTFQMYLPSHRLINTHTSVGTTDFRVFFQASVSITVCSRLSWMLAAIKNSGGTGDPSSKTTKFLVATLKPRSVTGLMWLAS